MRFADSMLLLLLASVVAVVAVCLAVFAWLGVQQLRAEAEGVGAEHRPHGRGGP